jgi:glycosidase
MQRPTPQFSPSFSDLPFEFHVCRAARDKYQFPHTLFATNGQVVFANFHAARIFAQRMNAQRDVANHPELAVQASQINALGMLDEVLHHLLRQYRQQKNGQIFGEALQFLQEQLGTDNLESTLQRFGQEFPPMPVYRGEITLEKYLEGSTDGLSHREMMLEELLMLWISNINPAAEPLRELFDDQLLSDTAYPQLINGLQEFFKTQPLFGPGGQNLLDLLRAPILARPDSLIAQLEYVMGSWGDYIGEYFTRMLRSLDFVKEETKPVFFGPGPALVPDYRRARRRDEAGIPEPEHFSPDKAWMPRTVMLAKNAYVWLEQLCRKYSAPIYTLDQIPDAELDELAEQGFSALWLIGLWERSRASQRIKQMCGNPDAVASAYSLLSYEIAGDLGGWPALENLRWRAEQRGIRMASDMVPNHMGIDADWVINHPDWFVSLPYPPFPTYTFNGANLSPREHIGIFLEDHYYDKTDAAVVFKRVDYQTGDTRYIYHGNDGTHMPWNDTAQLNYLIPEVREAVIQTILHVARNFPVIRFDAAMTLAKKHYQRLWFPEPGTGGDIASRAEHGMTFDDFEKVFPIEFWREVVDRVAQEAPETLLLAEAFWMMEGYFVRTLGMHRVYNSAFMNMLRDEENANYRLVIKNTLEFDPDILKRFVNFLNNPDEKTAIEQFGDGDKYFGCTTLMCTLPGLPMFGHGQIEGFAEKYGMEYRSAKWHEHPNQALIESHQREIFPLMHQRHLFAEVDNFVFYDFWTSNGVNEDVFAYSNRVGDQRALVIYHNRFAQARGWIRMSVGAMNKETRQLGQCTLSDGLGLSGDKQFALFRDLASDLEFIRSSTELSEKGLYVELEAYDRHVFWEWREVEDVDGRYAAIAAELNGRGVPDIDILLRERELADVLEPFNALVNAQTLRALIPVSATTETPTEAVEVAPKVLWEEIETQIAAVLTALQKHFEVEGETGELATEIRGQLETAQRLPELLTEEQSTFIAQQLAMPNAWPTLFSSVLVQNLGKVLSPSDDGTHSHAWLEELLFGHRLLVTLQEFGLAKGAANYAVTLTSVLTHFSNLCDEDESSALTPQAEIATPATTNEIAQPVLVPASKVLSPLFDDAEVQHILNVNRHNEVLWFNAEAWKELTTWFFMAQAVRELAAGADANALERCFARAQAWQQAARAAGYQVEKLVGQSKTADVA